MASSLVFVSAARSSPSWRVDDVAATPAARPACVDAAPAPFFPRVALDAAAAPVPAAPFFVLQFPRSDRFRDDVCGPPESVLTAAPSALPPARSVYVARCLPPPPLVPRELVVVLRAVTECGAVDDPDSSA